jgi:hypothetical protein
VSEPNDPVFWIDRLTTQAMQRAAREPPESRTASVVTALSNGSYRLAAQAFEEGFGLQTPMVR